MNSFLSEHRKLIEYYYSNDIISAINYVEKRSEFFDILKIYLYENGYLKIMEIINIVFSVKKYLRNHIFKDIRFIKIMKIYAINNDRLDLILKETIETILKDLEKSVIKIQNKLREYIYRPNGIFFKKYEEDFNLNILKNIKIL